MDEPATSVGTLFGGRLVLRQLAKGHRAGTDAVLLAASVQPETGARVADVGAGVGTVGLALALRDPTLVVDLIERDEAMARFAADNAERNRVAERVGIRRMNLFDRAAQAADSHRYDLVVSNPPFYREGEAQRPAADKAAAYVLDAEQPGLGHGDWLKACLALVRPRGALAMIHRPDALPALLAAAHNRLGGIVVRPVLPRAEHPAVRMLFAGRRGSRAPLRIDPPLVLHEPDGRFTPRAEALHRGAADQPLLPARKSRPRGPA